MENLNIQDNDNQETLPLTDGRIQRKISEIEKKISAILNSGLTNDVKIDLLKHLENYKAKFLGRVNFQK